MPHTWFRSARRSSHKPARRRLLETQLLETRLAPAIAVFQEGLDVGFGAYVGTVDTSVQQVNPTTSFGSASGTNAMLVDFTDPLPTPPNASHGLLRFNNIVGSEALGRIPAGAIIVSATMSLNTTNGGDGGSLNRMLIDWDGNVTWNSVGSGTSGFNSTPGLQADNVEANAVAFSQVGVTARNQDARTGATNIDVTADVQAWVNGTANYGWAMIPWASGTDGWDFDSSDVATVGSRPKLTVEWLPAGTVSLSFQEGVSGYTGTQDTMVDELAANQSKDNSNLVTIFVDYPDANNTNQALLRFDNIFGVGAGRVTPGSTILSAQLKLTSNNSTAAEGNGGSMNRMLVNWAESATWLSTGGGVDGFNNTPGIQADGAEARSSFNAGIGTSALTPLAQTWNPATNVTTDVQAWSDGEANYGWAILPWFNGTNGWEFDSSEDTTFADRPKLTVYYIPAPPPPPVSATLDVVAGQAVFIGGAGKANGVTLSVSGGNYTIGDSQETITLTASALAAGWMGDGTHSVFDTDGGTTSISIDLGDGVDTFTLNSLANDLTVITKNNNGDLASFPASVNYAGKVSITGFDSITQTIGTTLTVDNLTLGAGTLGTALNPIRTQAKTLAALGGNGGTFISETDGADLTVQATGPGAIGVTNITGLLTLVGKSKGGTADISINSGDGIAINGPFGDATTMGKITIAANTDGVGAEGFSVGPLGSLNTGSADAAAMIITVNTALGGTGDALVGNMGIGKAGTMTIEVNAGSIQSAGVGPLSAGGGVEPPVGELKLITTGANSAIGTPITPLQFATGTMTMKAGSGGIYVRENADQPSAIAEATAQGAGSIFIDTSNASDNGLWIQGPVTTGSGSITLFANDDLKVLASGSIGGPGFSGKFRGDANQDGSNEQVFSMQAGTAVETTSTAADAIVIYISASTNTTAIGGAILGNIKVGAGGGITIDANKLLGGGSDLNRAGLIRMLDSSVLLDAGSNGTVTLIARDNPIGESTTPIKTNAGTVTAITNSTDSTVNGLQGEADIFLQTTGAAKVAAATTTKDTRVGDIAIETLAGNLTLIGDVKTDTGNITLKALGDIIQTGGVITTTGQLLLSAAAKATFNSTGNSVATTTNIPAGMSAFVNGSFTVGDFVVDGTLGGSGTVQKVNVNATGRLSPDTSPGKLTTADLTMVSGSKYEVELNGASVGTGYNQLNVVGTVDLGGATLSPTLNFTPPSGSKYVIVNNDGIDTISTTFNGYVEGAKVTIGGVDFTITYNGIGGIDGVANDVILTAPGMATPPPTVSVLINGSPSLQRSLVTSIKVTFSEAVSFPMGTASAFKLERFGIVPPTGTVGFDVSPVTGPASEVTITFNNSGTVTTDPGKSLPDGQFKLTIIADKVMGTGGTLDGDGDLIAESSPSDDKVVTFHRLFGDADGNGAVNSDDFAAFRGFFGLGASIFDFNADGSTNSDDFAAFRSRFGLSGYLP